METENFSIIIKMFKELFPNTRQVEYENFIKIIEDAEKTAGGKIKAVDLDDLASDSRLKHLLGKDSMNDSKSFTTGSGLPLENKMENYKSTWLVAYVLAMQNSVEKR
jgi:hypothetical protein